MFALALVPALVNATHAPRMPAQMVGAVETHTHAHDVAPAGHSVPDHEHQTQGLPVNPREQVMSRDGDDELRLIAALAGTIRDGPREPPRRT